MSFPAYNDVKKSGVQWLSNIPLHWGCTRLKRLIAVVDSGTSVNASDEPAERDEIGVLKTSSVYTGEFRHAENKRVLREEYVRVTCPLRANTLIVSRMNTPDLIGAAGLVSEAPDNLFLPDRLWQVSFHDSVPSFLHYWTLTGDYRGQVKAACTGTSSSMKNLTQEQFGNFILAIPPLDEQKAITSFLDTETSKIDGLVSEQRRLIDLLKEKGQAVISHAVTKGLNPNAHMKPSGIQWLGDVPEHWEIGRLNHLVDARKGIAFKADDFIDEGVDVVKASDIKELTIRTPSTFLPKEFVIEYPKAVLHASELVLSTVGSNPEVLNSAVGQLGRVPENLAGSLLNQNTVVFSPNEETLTNHFLYYLIQTTGYRDHLDLHAHGTANQASLSVADMLHFQIPLPEPTEQVEIVDYLDRKMSMMDDLSAEAERAIELLKERRTALISAAVTGKIDVREFTPVSGKALAAGSSTVVPKVSGKALAAGSSERLTSKVLKS